MPAPDPRALLSARAVRDLLGVSAMTVHRWQANPALAFPRHVAVASGRVVGRTPPFSRLCRYACVKAGECTEPDMVCVRRRAAACLPLAAVGRRPSARGRTSEWR
jgi:hypothetical protein